MDIRLCQNKEDWDQYLLAREQSSFLQSWDWGEFQRAVGREPVRLRLMDDQGIVGQAQGFKHNLGLGFKYLYAPRIQNAEFRMQNICAYTKELGYVFIRVEPQSELRIKNYDLRFTENRQPQHTLILDVRKPLGELSSAMHSKTRYNIGLAEHKGVVVKEEKNAGTFWWLNQETTGRDKFRSHSREYYAKMLELGMAHQLTAEYEGKPIASNILIHFGDTMTYLHGASSFAHREVMAPYLLQWKGIELAKKLGCKQYDLWGIAPLMQNANLATFHNYSWQVDHRWSGITRFKVGFSAKGGPASGGGGTPVSYGQAVEVVLRPTLYNFYRIVKECLISVFSVFVFSVLL